jgi:hypothetical protein
LEQEGRGDREVGSRTPISPSFLFKWSTLFGPSASPRLRVGYLVIPASWVAGPPYYATVRGVPRFSPMKKFFALFLLTAALLSAQSATLNLGPHGRLTVFLPGDWKIDT